MRVVELALLLLGATAGAVGVYGALRTEHGVVEPKHVAMLRSSSNRFVANTLTSDSSAALLEVTVQRNPFRASRTASRVELLDGEAPSPRSEVNARPVLRLVGIVGGPPWSALLAGIPGRDGTALVSASDTAGGLLITAVDSVQVRVVGRDTVWMLTLERGQL